MIRFKPYRIIVNGSNYDDSAYERWKATGSDPAKKPKNLDNVEINTAPYPYFSEDHVAYETEVFRKLLKIKKFKTGLLVLAASQQLKDDLYIVPPGLRDLVIDGRDELYKAHFQMCSAAGASARPSNKYLKNSRVRFSPFLEASCSENDQHYVNDATLLHELVHGVRPQQFEKLKPQTTDDQWTDLEEFFATVVENIYRSERGDKEVRGSHHASAKLLPSTRAASAEFMNDKTHYERIKAALKREKLAQELAKLDDIPFNPFAEFNRAKRDLRSI